MLKIISIEEREKWDAVIRSFPSYDVYWLSGYVKAFQLHGDGEPILFLYEGADIRGVNVVMKRDIAKDRLFEGKISENTWFDFITPYGYGGWLIEGNGNSRELFGTYEKWCQENNIISEFVRYHPILKNHKRTMAAYDIVPLGETIAMDLASPEVIWKNITSKNRNVIRKAKKAGIIIYNGRYPEIYTTFHKIYNDTMTRDNADSYYYFEKSFYNCILQDLSTQAQVFYAELEGKVIAASIMLVSDGRLNYHLSGSLKEYQNLAPSNLLLYEAALWGCANGCKTFHLGGGIGSRDDSLYRFKKAFYRGEPYRFYIGKKIYVIDMYNKLCKLRCIDNILRNSECNYFPKYRAPDAELFES